MSINGRFKFGPATAKPAGGVQGLVSIKPEMMQQVFSSIRRAQPDEAPMKLMEFFPENRGTVMKCKIERDLAFSSPADLLSRIQDSRSVNTAQMTIFYNGVVNVYNVSAENAEAIKKLALSSCAKTMAPMMNSSERISKHHDSKDEQVRKLCGGLPIARKLSLQRFLQKRKDRTSSAAPYSSTWTAGIEKGNCKEEDMGLSLGASIP